MTLKYYIIASKYYVTIDTVKKVITVYKKDKHSEKLPGMEKYYLGSTILENIKYKSINISKISSSLYPKISKADIMDIQLGKDNIIRLSK